MSDLDEARGITTEVGVEMSMGVATDVPQLASPVKFKRRYKGFRLGFWIAAGWMVLVTLLAVGADWLPFVKPYAKTYGSNCTDGPSADHWLGCDNIGRDLFSRIAYGGRVSLFIGLMVVILSLAVGGAIGILAGYYRGKTDTVLSMVVDTILAIPPLVLLLFVVIVLGQNIQNIIVAVGILAIPTTARIVRANTLVYSQRDFVTAARVLGAKNRRIIWREVLPNVVPALVSYTFLAVGIIIVVEGILSFLGASVPPPQPTWGKIIAEGRQQLDVRPLVAILPGLVIFFTVLSLNIISDACREKFDVREAAI